MSPHTDSVGFTHVPDPAQHFDSRKRFLLLITDFFVFVYMT